VLFIINDPVHYETQVYPPKVLLVKDYLGSDTSTPQHSGVQSLMPQSVQVRQTGLARQALPAGRCPLPRFSHHENILFRHGSFAPFDSFVSLDETESIILCNKSRRLINTTLTMYSITKLTTLLLLPLNKMWKTSDDCEALL